MRVFALAGLVAALALGAGLLIVGRSQSSSSAAVHEIKPLHPKTRQGVTTTRPHPRKVAKSVRRAAARPRSKKAGAVINGMPAALARVLATHDVAVVSLFAPGGQVDDLAVKEARAGAALAGVGFVALNVLNERQAAALTGLLGAAQSSVDRVLDAPAVLVFQRPKTLFVRISGFADKLTVAQAASNAAPVTTAVSVPTRSDWAAQANVACTRMASRLQGVGLPTSPAAFLDVVTRITAIVQSTVDEIRALKPPTAQRAKVARMLSFYDQTLASLRAAISAARNGDRSRLAKLQARTVELGREGDAIAAELGATACSASGA